MGRQMKLLLWETEVVVTGGGSAQVVARKPKLEGSVDDARKALGGLESVSRWDVYRLIKAGYITAWKLKPGMPRKDGRAGNCKYVIDMESVLIHRQRMQEECTRPAERVQQNCFLF